MAGTSTVVLRVPVHSLLVPKDYGGNELYDRGGRMGGGYICGWIQYKHFFASAATLGFATFNLINAPIAKSLGNRFCADKK